MLVRSGYILLCAALALSMLVSCDSTDEVIEPVFSVAGSLEIDCAESDGVDSASRTITCTPLKKHGDSVKVKTFDLSDNYSAYIVDGDDLDDPEVDWESPVKPGVYIAVPDTGFFGIVVLDDKDRVADVWKVVIKKVVSSSSTKKSSSSSVKKSSSSSAKKSSSSSAKSVSSSSMKKSSSSSAKAASSSSAKKSSSSSAKSASSPSTKKSSSSSAKSASSSSAKSSSSSSATESSSSAVPESSSSEESSSSSIPYVVPNGPSTPEIIFPLSSEGEPVSSSSMEPLPSVLLREFGVDVNGSSVTVDGHKVYVEVPYGTNLKNLKLLPSERFANLERPMEMVFVDDLGVSGTYTVVAGMQLPGTHFDARDYTGFWATTSDAMENSVTEASIKIQSEANLEFGSSQMKISTKEVVGSFIGIEGSWKMAGGFYFAGTYSGTSAINIYQQGYSSGTPSTGASDITNDMSFGQSFTARPTGFDVTYSYSHVGNSNSSYPQKGLIYVMLVSSNGKVVASGAVTDDSSVGMHQAHVELVYGSDSGILSSGYPVEEGLSVGTGNEDVASIHVMFASSAYAFVVAGGTLGNDDKYRGGENSALVVDEFKLIYW